MINLDRTFRIPSTNLTKVTEEIQRLRERLYDVSEKVVARDAARVAIARIDHTIVARELDGEEVTCPYPITRAMRPWRDGKDENRSKPIGYELHDLRARLILIPHQGDIWGTFEIPLGLQDYWQEIMDFPGLEICDPDEAAEAWRQLLGGDLERDPALVGIEAVLHNGMVPIPDREVVVASCPSHVERVHLQARLRMPTNEGWTLEKRRAALDAEARKIAELLPREVTFELLRQGPYPDEPTTPAL